MALPSPTKIPQGYQKAELAIEGGEKIKVLFNPTEYTIAKTNSWNFKPVTGMSLPPAEYGGGNPREMTLNLLLDASLLGPDTTTVRDITDKLFRMMEVPGGDKAGASKAVPPFVTFQWGSVITFKAVCSSLTVAFQLFHPNGEPIRADVKMTLKQAEVAKSKNARPSNRQQNPTTMAIPGLGVHTVGDGDTLPSIAYDTYGEPNYWRVIAEANAIDDPLRLRRGMRLTLPRLG